MGLGLKATVLTLPPFSLQKVGDSSVGENKMLLNLEWRKLKGLRELMRATRVWIQSACELHVSQHQLIARDH